MSKLVLRIEQDGTLAGMYDDALVSILEKATSVSVKRMTDVRYNETKRGWEIIPISPEAREALASAASIFKNRGEAIATERRLIQEWLLRCKEKTM